MAGQNSRKGIRMRQVVAATLLSMLCACMSPIGRAGPVPPAGDTLADASFALASVPAAGDPAATEAVSLVRRALVAKGYRETPNGRYRLEIGLATAPLQVAVRGESDTGSRQEVRHP